MQLHELTSVVNHVLPPITAVQGDAVGLQVTSLRNTAQHILVAYEVTDAVITEAEHLRADVIVAFHPLIYTPLTTLGSQDRVPRLLRRLVRADIALVVVHTCYDAHPHGTTYQLAQHLGLEPVRPLVASTAVPGFGMGLVATSPATLDFAALLEVVNTTCGGYVRFVPPVSHTIATVALLGGSGMSYFNAAVENKADVFITADVKYHDFHAAAGVIGLIDVGHFESEQFVPTGLSELLKPHLPPNSVTTSSVITNPVHYLSPLPLAHSTPLTGSV